MHSYESLDGLSDVTIAVASLLPWQCSPYSCCHDTISKHLLMYVQSVCFYFIPSIHVFMELYFTLRIFLEWSFKNRRLSFSSPKYSIVKYQNEAVGFNVLNKLCFLLLLFFMSYYFHNYLQVSYADQKSIFV